MNLLEVNLARPPKPYLFFELPGEPISWQRPGGTFRRYDKQEKQKSDIGWSFRAACPWHRTDYLSKFGVRFRFLYNSGMAARRDVDNLEKIILDALQPVVWANDVQVREVYKIAAPARIPRTEVLIYPVSDDYLAGWSDLK